MPVHLQKEIEKLKKEITLLGGTVEKNLENALRSLTKRDVDMAKRIHDSDSMIDQWEVDIEEECLKILALHQPVAIDLRFIIAVLKINNDLERIGDEAVNISSRAMNIINGGFLEDSIDFSNLGQQVQKMVKNSLDALVNLDGKLARQICLSDDEVDGAVHEIFQHIKKKIKTNCDHVNGLIEYMRICRHLERIADHATNIAEDVLYMIEGEIRRHQMKHT